MNKLKSATGLKSRAPKSKFGPANVLLKFDSLPQDECFSLLARVLRGTALPLVIHMKSNFAVKSSPIVLRKGEKLMLFFGIEAQRVAATIDKGNECSLPLTALQLYERLPLEPALDDRVYIGTKAVIEAKPLPEAVRIVDAEYSADPMADQDAGDVITIRRVEVQNHPERGRERVLVGYDKGGSEVHFSEAMDLARYSTMVSTDFLPMSELVKFDMPQRVRMPDMSITDSTDPKRNKSKEKIMKLHRLYTDLHIIAARAKDDELLSIPINSDMDFDVIDASLGDIRGLLPAVFNRTNVTWSVVDVTQPRLPSNLRAVPQPLEGVFKEWAKSYEGKTEIDKCHSHDIKHLKQVLDTKQNELNKLKRCSSVMAPGPFVPARQTSFDGPPPSRPPREAATFTSRRASTPSMTYPVKPMPLPKPKNDDIASKPSTTKPISTPKGSISEEPDIIDELQTTVAKLQKEIHEKNMKIFELEKAAQKQQNTNEALRKERDGLKDAKGSDRTEILRLQTMIDRMYNSKQDGNIYEDLDDVVETHYSTPFSGPRLKKNMNVEGTLDFLRQVGLSQYCEVFDKEKIDGLMLLELDEGIMTEDLKMRKLDARRLKTKIGQQI